MLLEYWLVQSLKFPMVLFEMKRILILNVPESLLISLVFTPSYIHGNNHGSFSFKLIYNQIKINNLESKHITVLYVCVYIRSIAVGFLVCPIAKIFDVYI